LKGKIPLWDNLEKVESTAKSMIIKIKPDYAFDKIPVLALSELDEKLSQACNIRKSSVSRINELITTSQQKSNAITNNYSSTVTAWNETLKEKIAESAKMIKETEEMVKTVEAESVTLKAEAEKKKAEEDAAATALLETAALAEKIAVCNLVFFFFALTFSF